MAPPAAAIHAVDALKRALRVPPQAASGGPEWRDVSAYQWRTPRISSYDVGETDELIVALHTGGARGVRTRLGGAWSRTASSPGHLHVIPPRVPSAFAPEGELEFVSVHISPRRLPDGAAETLARMPFRFAFLDPFVSACVVALRDELRAPREHGPLFVDSVTDALALHLLRGEAPLPVAGERPAALSAGALSRVRERIEADLEAGVSLDELAAEARLSRSHFARAFRRTVGVPPHAYLTNRRIERAKELLRQTDLPLAEIALAVGFSSQSHFTARFRQVVGATPGRFRTGR